MVIIRTSLTHVGRTLPYNKFRTRRTHEHKTRKSLSIL